MSVCPGANSCSSWRLCREQDELQAAQFVHPLPDLYVPCEIRVCHNQELNGEGPAEPAVSRGIGLGDLRVSVILPPLPPAACSGVCSLSAGTKAALVGVKMQPDWGPPSPLPLFLSAPCPVQCGRWVL